MHEKQSIEPFAKGSIVRPSLLNAAEQLYRKGIFAHPLERIEDFIKEGESYPEVSSSIFPEVQALLSDRFDVTARYVTIEESTKYLLPWEIACCILEEKRAPAIYVRPGKWFFHTILKEAIVTHELIHAFRARLQSSIFEEHAAFDVTRYLFPTQISALRNWSGPLFSSPREALLICALLTTISLLPWFFASFASYAVVLLLITASIVYPSLRCAYRWHQWNKAKEILTQHFPTKAWKILIRLSDDEILELAHTPPHLVKQYIDMKKQTSWRWAIFIQTKDP